MKKQISFLLIALCCLFSACTSRRERIKKTAIEKAHNWIEWKYNTSSDPIYHEHAEVVDDNPNGVFKIKYSALIQFPRYDTPNPPKFVNDEVYLEFEYFEDEDRYVLKSCK